MSTRARRSTSTGGLVGTPAPVKHVAPDPVTLEEITEETARQMATDVIDWAICHGLAMRTTDHLADNGGVVEFAPITLLPTKLDADIFAEAMAIQKDLNLLYFNIGNDFEFLKNSLKEVIKGDEFTRKLFEILEKVHAEGVAQPLSLNVMRADYMLHKLPGSVDMTASEPGSDPSNAVKAHRTKKAKVEKLPDTFLKQVEVNTIAASFGGLSPQVHALHKYVLQSMLGYSEVQLRHILPENTAVQTIAEAIVNGWREYNDNRAVVMFVVEKESRNICDQRLLEYEVFKQSGGMIKIVRMTLERIATECHWDEAGKILTVPENEDEKIKQNGIKVGKQMAKIEKMEKSEISDKEHQEAPMDNKQTNSMSTEKPEHQIDKEEKGAKDEGKMEIDGNEPKKEEEKSSTSENAVDGTKTAEKISFGRPVAVAYFRAGYVPDQYPTDIEWLARERIERSRAIKCPSIGFHLAGTKKVQQILTEPGAVDPFVKGKRVAERLRAVFTEMYGFDDQEKSDAATEAVRANPTDFVLKPQREGGGNNIYGEEVLKKLEEMSQEEKAAHVLMQRIRPPHGRNCILRRGVPVEMVETLSELGIFGYTLGTKHSIKLNESGGYIFRTKHAKTDEGGIMAGASGLCTPFLIKS